MWKINITHDSRLALTTEAAGALLNSRKCPTLDTFSSGSQKPRQINGRRGYLRSRWRFSWKLRGRMTWGDQGLVSKTRSFIFNRGFYILSYTQSIIGDAKSAVFDPYQQPGFFFPADLSYTNGLGDLHHLLARRPINILWLLTKTYQPKDLFPLRVIILKFGAIF